MEREMDKQTYSRGGERILSKCLICIDFLAILSVSTASANYQGLKRITVQ